MDPFRDARPTSGIVIDMSGPSIVDVTDATFETDVIEVSMTTPVIVDLWAPWCGPCKTLTPVLEKVVSAANGKVVLAKVNIDENPGIAQAFRVQSIPMVVAIKDGAPVTAFQGAQPEHVVQQFIQELMPSARDEQIASLLARGDEESLRAVLSVEPGNEMAIVALANMMTARGEGSEALALLGRVPETDEVRKAAAAARLSMREPDDYDEQLEKLLDVVKADEVARQQFLDILEVMGADDPRTAAWRKKLTARLY
jgi:putative thioredoxin